MTFKIKLQRVLKKWSNYPFLALIGIAQMSYKYILGLTQIDKSRTLGIRKVIVGVMDYRFFCSIYYIYYISVLKRRHT